MNKTTKIAIIVSATILILGLAAIAAFSDNFGEDTVLEILRILGSSVLGFIAGKTHSA